MIASALLTVLLVTTWGCYATASRSIARVSGRFDVFFKLIAFRRAFIQGVQGASPYPQTANAKSNFKGESKKLTFTSLSSPFPVPTTGEAQVSPVQWVAFDKTPGGIHYVAANPYFFLSDRADKEKGQRTQFKELKSWEFGYYDGSSWSTAWDFSLKRRLPQRVRVKYTISDEKREVEDIITVAIAQEGEPYRMQANPFAGIAPPQPGMNAPGQPVPGQPQQPPAAFGIVNTGASKP